jgi:hypothetical protein
MEEDLAGIIVQIRKPFLYHQSITARAGHGPPPC